MVARDFLESKGFKVEATRSGEPDLLVGGKNFTEHFILGYMLAQLIESQTNLTVGTQLGLAGTKIVFDALTNQEINLYPEYTGTGLHVLLNANEATVDSLGNSSLAVYEYVKQESQRRFEIGWLQPFGFENTYALMMRREHANRLGIESISDLTEYLDEEKR